MKISQISFHFYRFEKFPFTNFNFTLPTSIFFYKHHYKPFIHPIHSNKPFPLIFFKLSKHHLEQKNSPYQHAKLKPAHDGGARSLTCGTPREAPPGAQAPRPAHTDSNLTCVCVPPCRRALAPRPRSRARLTSRLAHAHPARSILGKRVCVLSFDVRVFRGLFYCERVDAFLNYNIFLFFMIMRRRCFLFLFDRFSTCQKLIAFYECVVIELECYIFHNNRSIRLSILYLSDVRWISVLNINYVATFSVWFSFDQL